MHTPKHPIKRTLLGCMGLGVLFCFSFQLHAAKKPSFRALRTTIQWEKWGLSSPRDIRLGQVGVIFTKKGPKLHVYKLKNRIPKVPKKPILQRVPPIQKGCFLLSHFSMGNTNRLGGHFNHFQRAPSSAHVGIQKEPDQRYALSLKYKRESKGFCGFWVHLFDFKQARSERIYLDASPFKWLVFWIKGKQGGERIRLKMADAFWEKKGDALPVDELHTFTREKRILNRWQRVAIPLRRFPRRIRREQLASMVFEAVQGSGEVAIKTVALCQNKQNWPTLPNRTQESRFHHIPHSKRGKALATWLWDIRPFFKHPKKQIHLARFLRKKRFTDVFIQLPNRPKNIEKPWPKSIQRNKWRPLIRRLHQHKVRAIALDGFKEYALPKWHERVRKTVQHIIHYNRSVSKIERFDGIRFDIEPYLLQEFRGAKKGWLLRHFLRLLQSTTAMAHKAGLTLGVDIPFWFDARHAETGKQYIFDYRGQLKTLSDHIIDIVDDIGIMDYRTRAYGADGIITHALGELRYASLMNKRVFIGLETLPLPNEALFPFRGPARHSALPKSAKMFVVVHRTKTHQTHVHLVSSGHFSTWKRNNPSFSLRSPAWYIWPVHRVINVPSTKISFARLGLRSFSNAMIQARRELNHYSSFAGFAIHSYKSYRALLAKP